MIELSTLHTTFLCIKILCGFAIAILVIVLVLIARERMKIAGFRGEIKKK